MRSITIGFRCGGTEAATFCALTSLCKQLDSCNSMDVYQVTKLYHNKRPGIWRTQVGSYLIKVNWFMFSHHNRKFLNNQCLKLLRQDDILYLYEALETLIASKSISNPLQEGGLTISTDFPLTAYSSEGGGTATTIEMVDGESNENHDGSVSVLDEKPCRRTSESISVSSTAASK